MAYNWTSVTTPENFLSIPNANTGGWFWYTIIIVLFIILFMTLINYGWLVAILTSSFISLIASILTTYAQLTNFSLPLLFTGAILILILYIFTNSPGENT